jgi:hypothetical protein
LIFIQDACYYCSVCSVNAPPQADHRIVVNGLRLQ